MSTKQRIISFILALTLLFGCMALTVSAVANEVAGGEITNEDIKNGTTDAIISAVPEGTGPMTYAEIKAILGAGGMISSNVYSVTDRALYVTYKNDNGEIVSSSTTSSGNSMNVAVPITVGAHQKDFTCGMNAEVYFQVSNYSASNYPNATSNYNDYIGKSFVISFDMRIEATAVFGMQNLVAIRTYLAHGDNSTAMTTMDVSPLYIDSTGQIYLGNNASNPITGAKVAKSTADKEADFTNIAIHVTPKTNTYDLYVDGVSCLKDQTFLSSSAIKKTTFNKDTTYNYTVSNVTTEVTYDRDIKGGEDYLFSLARFMPMYCTYHGEECSDTCTKAGVDNKHPANFDAAQYSTKEAKAYFTDVYFECAEHDLTASSVHTHDEATMTASTTVSCSNCKGEWKVTLPIDQTGNSLCDLCELQKGQLAPHATADVVNRIKSSVTVGEVSIIDGSTNFTRNPDQVDKVVEDGNTYYELGANTIEFYNDFTNPGTRKYENFVPNFLDNNLAVKGKSFVVSLDLRLGDKFFDENQSFQLVKFMSYSFGPDEGDTVTNDSKGVEISLLTLTKDGEVLVRDGATGNNEPVVTLTADKFTTVAAHVKITGDYGEVLVYVDGTLAKTVRFFTNSNYTRANTDFVYIDANQNEFEVDLNGISDYTLNFARFLHAPGSDLLVNDDVLNADNLMLYYADDYAGAFTQHNMVNEAHKHDYSEVTVRYGTYCSFCGGGEGGYTVLDANGDKLCDVCVAQKLNISANGIIAPDKLSATPGVDTVRVGSTINNTTYYGFSGGADTAKLITYKEKNGNAYIEIAGKIEDKNGGQTYLTYTAVSKNTTSNIANNFKYAGQSFVVSTDIILAAELQSGQVLLNLFSYMDPTKDGSGNITAFASMQTNILSISNVGEVNYYDAKTASTKGTGYFLKPGAEEFTTLSVFVRPGEGEYGLYTIYADGVAITGDLQFLSESTSEIMEWTCGNVTSTGANDYILNSVRAFPLYASSENYVKDGAVSDTMLVVDNPKLYYADTFVECAKHNFKLTNHTHNLNNKTIEATAKCGCGVEKTIELPLDTVKENCCDSCGVNFIAGLAEVMGRQVILGDRIELKLYLGISDAAINNPDAAIVATYRDKTVTFPVSELECDENGIYTVSLKLTSVEMASDVTFGFLGQSADGGYYTTSVRDYAMCLVNDASQGEYTRTVAKAMLNYGAYAQIYFAEKNEMPELAADLANALLCESDKSLGDATDAAISAYAITAKDNADGKINLNSAKLVLEDAVSMKLYFTASIGARVTVDGKESTVYNEGGNYVIKIDNVLPHYYSHSFDVVITTADGTFEASVSVLSCVNAIIKSSQNSKFVDLARAIYLFNLMTRIYNAESEDIAKVVVKNDAKGATAIVFDDGDQQTATFVSDKMKEYTDVSVSFALITKNLGTLTKVGGEYVIGEDGKYVFTQTETQTATAEYWNNLIASTDNDGKVLRARVELISHSQTHNMPDDADYYAELLGARHILQTLFGYDSEALVTPGGFDKNDDYNRVKMEVYIAARGTTTVPDVQRMLATLAEFAPENRKKIDAFMVTYNKTYLTNGEFNPDNITVEQALNAENAANGVADVSHVENFISAAMESGTLAAFCFHTVRPTTYEKEGGLHIYNEQADAILAYVQRYAETGELWSTTFTTACKYYGAWSTSKLDVRALDGVIFVSLTDGEDNEIYDEALTVKISVPDDWQTASANGNTLTVKGENGAKYVLVDILPDSGIVSVIGN